MRFRLKSAILISIVCSLVFAPIAAWACGGGFFGPTDASIYPNVTRVVFGVNKAEGTITEIVGINYTGSAADFSWVMPLPSAPKVDVAKTSDLDYLEDATRLNFDYGINFCANLNSTQFSGFGGGGGGAAGEIGPYDYTIVKNAAPDEMLTWLKTNGYSIPANARPIISDYVKAGDVFLAMRLKPGADIQDIQPIVLTYKADQPTFPIRLGGVTHSGGSNDSESILTWIFGDTQYKPGNYASASLPDFSAIRDENEVLSMGTEDVLYDSSARPLALYDDARTQTQAKYNGQAFITEYAQPTAGFASDETISPALTNLIKSYPYMTRLSAQLSANQETLDPVFVPAPKSPNVSNDIELGQKTDPLALHGCSTQTAVSPRVATEFAKSHTRFPDLNFTVGYPPGWVLSVFTVKSPNVDPQTQLPTGAMPIDDPGDTLVYVYAPKLVTSATLDDYFKGQPTPPMFAFVPLGFSDPIAFGNAISTFDLTNAPNNLGNTDPNLALLLMDALGQDNTTEHFPVSPAHVAGQDFVLVNVQPYPGSWCYSYSAKDNNCSAPPDYPAVLFGVLATDSDWQANAPLYQDMLDYAQAHLYALDANTRDSLFLSASTGNGIDTAVVSDIFTLPLSDGWTAHTDADGDVLLMPANVNADSGPTMRLSIVGGIGGYNPFGHNRFDGMVLTGDQAAADPNQLAAMVDNVTRPLARYGFPTSPIDPTAQSALTQCPKDPTTVKAMPFTHNGLTGQVALTTDYIAAIYAPDAEYAQYKDLLQTMMNAYLAGYICRQAPNYSYGPPPQSTDQANQYCPASPPSQVDINVRGRVTPGAPDNLRTAPDARSNVLAVLKAGETFTVLDGPACDPVTGITWWKVQYQAPDGKTLVGWIAEGQGKTYFIEPAS